MIDESYRNQLADIIGEVRNCAEYLKELGVERFESPEPVPVIPEPIAIALPAPTPSNTTEQLRTAPVARPIVPMEPPPTRPSPTETYFFEDMKPGPPSYSTLVTEPAIPHNDTSLEDIRRDIGDCRRCELWSGRTNIVHADGNPNARLMFIGEAPGADEDAQGKPFVGRAGQLLTKIIEAIGMKREDVMIGNINRCRPPGNRPPTPAEAAVCRPFILRDIDVVKPEVIVVLGNTALVNLLDYRRGISSARGYFHDYRGIKVMPTFHPAYLLRDPSKKREVWDDMKKVRDYLDSRSKV